MLQHPAAVRAGFEEAARTFLGTIRSVEDHQWALPSGLGGWNVRELTAHTLRAFTTIELYVNAGPTVDRPMADAAEYYRVALADPTVHAGILQRGRDGAAQLDDPVGESEATSERVLALCASTDDDEPVNSPFGQITFSEYLATRTVELGVHTLDLQRATGKVEGLHHATATVVLAVLTDLADATRLILALTGRRDLPTGYTALG
jgi:uncharacterized protein (TIGR03083 family)